MKRGLAVVGVLCCFLISCGKPYIGWKVDYNWEEVCTYAEYQNNGKKQCIIDHGSLIFDFTIRKGENEGEYVVEGFVDPTQGDIKSWDRMMWEKTRFDMLVARDGVIIDNVGFRSRTAFGSLSRKWPFTIQYHQPEGFDAVAFVWKMGIRG